jgi:hypothetical protein
LHVALPGGDRSSSKKKKGKRKELLEQGDSYSTDIKMEGIEI